jgi:hypothetical protein
VDTSKLRLLNQDDYRVLSCTDGKGYTIEKKNDKGFFRMHSAYDPYREGQLLAEKILKDEPEGRVYLRIGFGFGYMYNFLLPRADKRGDEIVVYEPSYDVFNYFIRLFDISKLFTGYPIQLYVQEGTAGLNNVFPHLLNKVRAKQGSYFFTAYTMFFSDEIENCIKHIEVNISDGQIGRNTIRTYSKIWAKNSIANFPYILNGREIDGLIGVIKGKPAIMVAAGPSLNKNVHLLKEIQGKVLIGAVYTAIKTLEKHDVKPDFFMALDGNQFPYEIREGYNFKDIYMMLYTSVGHKLYESHPENNFIITAGAGECSATLANAVLSNMGRSIIEYQTMGGTVAHVITEFLRVMGASVIVMLGQDLAFTDGQHHAKEYTEGQDYFKADDTRLTNTGKRFMVEDVYGGQVETDGVYSYLINQYSDYAKHFKHAIELVDATEGGAKIEHTKIMSFREAIDTYMADCTDPEYTKTVMNQAWEKGMGFDESDEKKALRTFEEMLVQCKKLIELVDEALPYAQKVYNLYRFNRIPTQKELSKPLGKLNEYVQMVEKYRLISRALSGIWTAKAKELKSFKHEDEHHGHYDARVAAVALTLQKDACEGFIPVLEETITKMKEGRGV